jgi:hypothetical protein
MAYLTNRQAPNSGLANLLAMKGRMGDTELVHMSKPEIDMLERMGEMTRNPMTGLPEAFSLEEELAGLASLVNVPNAKDAMNDLMEFGKEKLKTLTMKEIEKEMPKQDMMMMPPMPPQQMLMPQPQQSGGGIAMLAGGARPKDYFEGQVYDDRGDGMSDDIDFKVEGDPVIKGAKLSADEYVLPADLVAMLGNGSSDAGAKKLDKFTKEMRTKAFGTTKQQKPINATKELREIV